MAPSEGWLAFMRRRSPLLTLENHAILKQKLLTPENLLSSSKRYYNSGEPAILKQLLLTPENLLSSSKHY
jgi:hypothetical protein